MILVRCPQNPLPGIAVYQVLYGRVHGVDHWLVPLSRENELPPNAHRVKNRGGEHLDQIRAGQGRAIW